MYVIADELYHHGVKGQKWGVRRERKAERTLARGQKRLARSQRYDEKTMMRRAKRRDKLATKYGEKSVHVRDFDEGTKLINSGSKKYNKILKDYYDQKAKAIMNSDVKMTAAYKKAKKSYDAQQAWDWYYGNSGTTKLYYAADKSDDMDYNYKEVSKQLKAERKAYRESKRQGGK